MARRDVTVILSGRDLIVDTEAVGRYLSTKADGSLTATDWKSRPWRGEGLDLIWFETLDHAQVFDSKKNYGILVQVTRTYAMKEERMSIRDSLVDSPAS